MFIKYLLAERSINITCHTEVSQWRHASELTWREKFHHCCIVTTVPPTLPAERRTRPMSEIINDPIFTAFPTPPPNPNL